MEPFPPLHNVKASSDIVNVLPLSTLNMVYKLLPDIVKLLDPEPMIVISVDIEGKSFVNNKVPDKPDVKSIRVILGSAFAEVIAHLKVPTLPSSLVLVTVIVFTAVGIPVAAVDKLKIKEKIIISNLFFIMMRG